MAAKGQNTRDKFFLDFVAGATQLPDPFGKERYKHAKKIDWLPDLLVDDERAAVAQVATESIAELKQLFTNASSRSKAQEPTTTSQK